MENTFHTVASIPKGIDISEPGHSGPEVEECTFSSIPESEPTVSESQSSWCYLYVHHSKVGLFADRLNRDGVPHFIHKSVTYERKKQARGVRAVERPTVSGLIFLQGAPRMLQDYLNGNFPDRHLVNDCSTRRPAVIPDRVMQPFMRVLQVSPERVRILLRPFTYYAGRNVLLRITTGFLAGIEGYVIRIDRDRRLIMNVGGMSVAISGIHCEKFEVVAGEAEKHHPAKESESRQKS